MSKLAAGSPLAFLQLDRSRSQPLHRQLYEELRTAILTERLRPGERLPSTRTLAIELGVSRRTVLDAFLQLYAEGYVDGRIGAGTFVADTIAKPLLRSETMTDISRDDESRLSDRFLRQQAAAPPFLVESPIPPPGQRAFMLGMPALDAFPNALWRRMASRLGRGLGLARFLASPESYFSPAI